MIDNAVFDELKRINTAGLAEVRSEFEQLVLKEIISWMLWENHADLSKMTKQEIYETFWNERLA
jgi:hypothetical protein